MPADPEECRARIEGNDILALGGTVGETFVQEGTGAHQTVVSPNAFAVFGGSGAGDIVEGGMPIGPTPEGTIGGSGDDQTPVGVRIRAGSGDNQTLIGGTMDIENQGTDIHAYATNPGDTVRFTGRSPSDLAAATQSVNPHTGVDTTTFADGQVVKVAGVAQVSFFQPGNPTMAALAVTQAEVAVGTATSEHESQQVQTQIAAIMAAHHV
jgi:hypothetical protein